jgi:hypothetical protein
MLSLALVMCLGLSPLPQLERAGEPAVEWTQLSLDELLARLPQVEQDRRYDPLAQEWVTTPAADEMARRLQAGMTLSDEQWRETLLRTGVLRFRSRWPAGHKYAVSLRRPSWLPNADVELFSKEFGVKGTRMELFEQGCGQGGDFSARRIADFRTLGRLRSAHTSWFSMQGST